MVEIKVGNTPSVDRNLFMPANAENLKNVATNLILQRGGHHERLRKLIVAGFFDAPKTTEELVKEIRQTTGKNLRSNSVQTYMKKFMHNNIIRVLQNKKHRGNFWVLASENEVKAAQLSLSSNNGESATAPPASTSNTPEAFSLPTHPLLGTAKTKILFLAANPIGTDHLALDRECREIGEKICASQHRDGLEFITQWAVRTRDILQYLNQHRAHVIHFSGHGSLTEELMLLDANDQAKPVSKTALKQMFTTLKDNIRVVVLNACYSRPQAETITEVIDCAIGMNRGIGDKAAIVFAAAFYQAIGFGRSVKAAFECGKTQLMLEGIPEEKTPELLVRKGIDPANIYLVAAVQDRNNQILTNI
jgi:hypothetical protein